MSRVRLPFPALSESDSEFSESLFFLRLNLTYKKEPAVKVTKEIEKLDNSSVKVTVTIGKKDVAAGYADVVAKYAKDIQMPGFRKGKVPVSIMERKYGEALKNDAMSELVEKALGDIFDEFDKEKSEYRPLPYAQPTLDGAPTFDTTKDLTFSVIYDIFPSVKVTDLSGITVKEPQVTLTDDDLKQELDAIRERNAMVYDKKDDDAVAKDDIVTVNYWELDDDGNVKEDTKRQDFVFTVGSGQNIYKFDDDVIGMLILLNRSERISIWKRPSFTFSPQKHGALFLQTER